MVTFAELRTPNGHACGEVTSALQKAIRRGDERAALYWMSELDLAGYGGYCWKRLRLIASEDCGLADSNVAVQVRSATTTTTVDVVARAVSDRTVPQEQRAALDTRHLSSPLE
jgi:replication-associated recombination protein RarA